MTERISKDALKLQKEIIRKIKKQKNFNRLINIADAVDDQNY